MKVKSLKINLILLSMLVAIFVTGIISCSGGDNITGSGGFSIDNGQVPNQDGTTEEPKDDTGTTEPDTPTTPDDKPNTNLPLWEKDKDFSYLLGVDNNGDTGKTWNIEETKGKTFYGSSYRTLYLFGASQKWIKVSYNDTDRLTRMWKFMIDRGRRDGNHRLYIKTDDGDFFFDADYNIRWSKKPDTILKRFQGGVIAQLRKGGAGNNVHAASEYGIIGGEAISGKFTIGGLYTFAMHVKEAEKLNSDRVNQFFGRASDANHSSGWNLYGGRMEILVMHAGYPVDLGTGLFRVVHYGVVGTGWSGTAYAAQTYMAKFNNGYEDGNSHLWNIKGNTPERYMPGLDVTHQLYELSFRWALDKTYAPNNYR